MSKIKKILLSFVGNNDAGELVGYDEHGSILTALAELKFDYINLLFTPGKVNINHKELRYEEIAEYLSYYIITNYGYKEECISINKFNCERIADHTFVFKSLTEYLKNLSNKFNVQSCEFNALISSGTPQMQASWILIAEADVFPIKLIKAIEKKYSKGDVRTENVNLLTNLKAKLEKLKVFEKRLGSKYSNRYSDVYDVNNLSELQIDVAKSNNHVLIYGETGVGKEVLARTIHIESGRQQFFPINCAGIPEHLLESELFGHKKGSFTGAIFDKKGIVKEFVDGTLFLDEINSLPLSLQAKLLRFIESGEFRPLGSSLIEKSTIRIIAAANEKLHQLVKEERFRADLYYRLRTFEFNVVPLRKKKSQIPVLIDRLKLAYSLNNFAFDNDALNILMGYTFPGNVRELIIILNRLSIISKNGTINSSQVKKIISELSVDQHYNNIDISKDLHGKAYKLVRNILVNAALDISNNNTAEAGRILGVTHNTIKKWSEKE